MIMTRQMIQSSIMMARAQFKLKIEGNYLGIMWYIMEPLALFMIFMSIKKIVGKGIEQYPLYLLIGLIMFNFFRKATSLSAVCLTSNSNLITSLRVNIEMFVMASFFEALIVHIFEFMLFASVLICLGASPIYLLLYAPVLFLFGLFVLGISFILAFLGVYINDITNAWVVITRVLWFATPIFYKARIELPLNLNAVNPMYHFISAGRDLIIYHRLPAGGTIVFITFAGLVVFSLGYGLFLSKKGRIAENI